MRPQPLLTERAVAVCAFESARIVLSCGAKGSSDDEALARTALEKARLCLEMSKRHFPRSAPAKTLA